MRVTQRSINIVSLVITVFVIALASWPIWGSNYGGDTHITNVHPTETYYITEQVTETVDLSALTQTTLIDKYTMGIDEGISDSMAMDAIDPHCDYETGDWQWNLGLGNSNSSNAAGGNLCKRFGSVLLSGGYKRALESERDAVGINVGGRF